MYDLIVYLACIIKCCFCTDLDAVCKNLKPENAKCEKISLKNILNSKDISIKKFKISEMQKEQIVEQIKERQDMLNNSIEKYTNATLGIEPFDELFEPVWFFDFISSLMYDKDTHSTFETIMKHYMDHRELFVAFLKLAKEKSHKNEGVIDFLSLVIIILDKSVCNLQYDLLNSKNLTDDDIMKTKKK